VCRKISRCCEAVLWCAPVLTLLGGHARGGVVRRRVKPDVFAVDQEGVPFPGPVIPAHFAGPQKVSLSGLNVSDTTVVEVALEEGGLEGVGGAVARLNKIQNNLSAFRYGLREKRRPAARRNLSARRSSRAPTSSVYQVLSTHLG
jgi:hypothetical protein